MIGDWPQEAIASDLRAVMGREEKGNRGRRFPLERVQACATLFDVFSQKLGTTIKSTDSKAVELFEGITRSAIEKYLEDFEGVAVKSDDVKKMKAAQELVGLTNLTAEEIVNVLKEFDAQKQLRKSRRDLGYASKEVRKYLAGRHLGVGVRSVDSNRQAACSASLSEALRYFFDNHLELARSIATELGLLQPPLLFYKESDVKNSVVQEREPQQGGPPSAPPISNSPNRWRRPRSYIAIGASAVALLLVVSIAIYVVKTSSEENLAVTILSIDQNPPEFAFEDADEARDFVEGINPARHIDDYFEDLYNTEGAYAVSPMEIHVQLTGNSNSTVTVHNIEPQIVGGENTGRRSLADGALVISSPLGGADPPHRMTFVMEDPTRTAREDFLGLAHLDDSPPFFSNNTIDLDEGKKQQAILEFYAYLYAYDFEIEVSYEVNGTIEQTRIKDEDGNIQVFRLTGVACPEKLNDFLADAPNDHELDTTVIYEEVWHVASFGSSQDDPAVHCNERLH